jgi:hypothetical protein
LFPHRLPDHGRVGINGFFDRHSQGWLGQDQLGSDGGEELGSLAAVAVASLEEEATAEAPFGGDAAGDGARNGGLAGASHTIEPEDGLCLRIISPFIYLVKEVDSRVGVASCAVFLGVGVEGGSIGGWEFGKDKFLIDGEQEIA